MLTESQTDRTGQQPDRTTQDRDGVSMLLDYIEGGLESDRKSINSPEAEEAHEQLVAAFERLRPLIMAAPDLLEVCELWHRGYNPGDPTHWIDQAARAKELTAAVIKKAKG